MMRLIGVYKSFGGKDVLKDVSAREDPGDFIIVRGKSGSGKSTLLKILGGFLKADHGKILWKGEDIAGYKERERIVWRRENLGFVFQDLQLIPYLSAKENVCLPMVYQGMKQKDAQNRAERLLNMVGCGKVMNQDPKKLSGGEAQRAAIARALGNMPGLILCDEPTGSLDTQNAKTVMKLLKTVNRYRKTVIVVTHDSSLEQYGNRVWDIAEGRLKERC